MIARGQQKVRLAGRALAHRLVHEILAPSVGRGIANAVEDRKAFFGLEFLTCARSWRRQSYRINCDAIRALEITIAISASIGIAIAPRDGIDFDELAGRADAALYWSKREGKGRFHFCAPQTAAVPTSAQSISRLG